MGDASATDASQVVFSADVYSHGLTPAFHTAAVPPLFSCCVWDPKQVLIKPVTVVEKALSLSE